MADADALFESLQAIASRADRDMSERDVENLFLETGFYDALGYEGTGTDIRSEFTLPDDRRPDYITLDANEAVSAVYEFKTTGRDLTPHTDQLFHYMNELRSEYGVITNGEELRLYRRGENDTSIAVALGSVSESQARDITSTLKKRERDITDPEAVQQLLADLDPVPLDTELGQEHFFDTFRLEEDSPFANLVVGLMDLLTELRDENEAKFVKGAYDFWEATYASEPNKVPDSWEPFIDGKQSLRDFMFCLESGHALLARLLLAKATEDHAFFASTPYNGMADYFRGLQGFGNDINPDAYPVAAKNLIGDMQAQLVENLFEDDIFIWWADGYKEELTRGHKSGASQFQDVAYGIGDQGGITLVSEATRQRFSRSVAHVFFAILKFNFSAIEGDPLGDLYQRYFDPETRKALGEFYTPQPVIEYIMDGVGYDRGVSNRRLIDPSCGSGTFLVEAVERYIADVERYEDDPNWQEHLRKLCTQPNIVGLDIHPFAVLMAQIRFVVAVLPAYRKAKRTNPDFTLRRLPIFRTDTLRDERKLTGLDLGDDGTRQMTFDAMTEDEQDVRIPVPLPIEVDEDEVEEAEDGFLVRRVRMPLFDTIKLETGVGNFGEYFAALQGVLDVVKAHMDEMGNDQSWDWTYVGGLQRAINRYTSQEYDGVEEFFEPYVNDMLENVRYLQDEHDDGRLFKIFEDTVLALVVKNYMEYDFVVGNPPYVRVQHLPDRQKVMFDRLYDSTTGNYDIYCLFFERGLDFLRDGSGKLGYITSNQFLLSDYGEGIRRVLANRATIEEVFDFRDSEVFEDAANLPVIVTARAEADAEARSKNQIRCIRVKSNVGKRNAVDEGVVDIVRENRESPGYSDEFVDIFDHPQAKLSDTFWSLMPPDERRVFETMEDNADGLMKDVTDSIFAGTQTSANGIYIVTLQDEDRVGTDQSGGTVTVSPTGDESRTFEIETDLLRPWLQGIDVKRWRGNWAGQHVILPYYIKENDGDVQVETYSADYLQENCPKTWDYFTTYRDTLEGREGGRMEGRDDWYAFIYPKSHERFEKPKIINADMASHARYMIDDEGEWYFKTPYGIQLTAEKRDKTRVIACQLNSSALDFYLKHIAPMLLSSKYRYQARYIEHLPGVISNRNNLFGTLRNRSTRITNVLDLDNKTGRFPEAYLGGYDGELEYITYEWQTRRYPVSADIQETVDGDMTVQAGRSDVISDPAMYADDRDERRRRAEYVHAAVDGRNVKSGEETTIPIPRTDAGVKQLLAELEADRAEVKATDIEALEAEIDEAVYDLFDLAEDERQVIEDYLEVF